MSKEEIYEWDEVVECSIWVDGQKEVSVIGPIQTSYFELAHYFEQYKNDGEIDIRIDRLKG